MKEPVIYSNESPKRKFSLKPFATNTQKRYPDVRMNEPIPQQFSAVSLLPQPGYINFSQGSSPYVNAYEATDQMQDQVNRANRSNLAE